MRISDWSSDVCSSDLVFCQKILQRGAEGSSGKKLRTPAARREAALRLMAEHGFSQRRACRLIEVDPKTVRREATADAQAVRQRLRELAGERSEAHTSELQSLMRTSSAVLFLKKKNKKPPQSHSSIC